MPSRRTIVHPQGGPSGPSPPFPGYVLKFRDEFTSFNGNVNGTNGWRTTYAWGSTTGGSGNHEAESYNDVTQSPFNQPFTISGSVLSITASKASATGTNSDGLPYNSGILVSDQSFFFKYGYVECRAKLPAGVGLWPAIWMLATINEPPSPVYNAEWDIMEALGNDLLNIYQTLHSGTNGAISDGPHVVPVSDYSTNFHVYAMDWNATTITLYVDGIVTNTLSTPATLQQAAYLLMDFAVGGAGSWPGPPDGTTVFPAVMQVDYMRVWANPSTTGVGGSLALP